MRGHCAAATRVIDSLLLCGWILVGLPMAAHAEGEVQDLTSERWSGGVGTGFVGSTPDGIAEFAMNGHADYFVSQRLSIGPLAQYAGAGNDFLFAISPGEILVGHSRN